MNMLLTSIPGTLSSSTLSSSFDYHLFFITVGLLLFVVLWLFHGSPTLFSAIIAVGVFAATSDVLIWRKLFSLDKKTAVSFVKLKHDVSDLRKDMDCRFDTVEGRFDRLEKLIKTKT